MYKFATSLKLFKILQLLLYTMIQHLAQNFKVNELLIKVYTVCFSGYIFDGFSDNFQ